MSAAHSRVMNSSRFSSTRATIIQAARSGASGDTALASAGLAAKSDRCRPGTIAAGSARARSARAPGTARKAYREPRRVVVRRPRGRSAAASPWANSKNAGVVEQRQRLQRRVRAVPPGAGADGVGGVEDDQSAGAGPTARSTCTCRGGSGRRRCSASTPLSHLGEAVHAVRLRREHARARRPSATAGRSPPGPTSRTTSASSRSRDLPGEQPVAGVDRRQLRPGLRRLPVGRRRDDQPVHRLQAASPRATNSLASQSSSSGCDGGVPWVPKSFSVSTRPRPKNCLPERLTVTRAVSGFAGSTSHCARSSRVAALRLQRRQHGRHAGRDLAPGRVKSPPSRTCVVARRLPLADDHRRDDRRRPASSACRGPSPARRGSRRPAHGTRPPSGRVSPPTTCRARSFLR